MQSVQERRYSIKQARKFSAHSLGYRKTWWFQVPNEVNVPDESLRELGAHTLFGFLLHGESEGQQSTGSRREGGSLHTQPRLTETHNQPVQMTKASLGSHRGRPLRHPDTASHVLQLCRLPAAGLTVAGAPGDSDWSAPGGHFSPALSPSLPQGPLVSRLPYVCRLAEQLPILARFSPPASTCQGSLKNFEFKAQHLLKT